MKSQASLTYNSVGNTNLKCERRSPWQRIILEQTYTRTIPNWPSNREVESWRDIPCRRPYRPSARSWVRSRAGRSLRWKKALWPAGSIATSTRRWTHSSSLIFPHIRPSIISHKRETKTFLVRSSGALMIWLWPHTTSHSDLWASFRAIFRSCL